MRAIGKLGTVSYQSSRADDVTQHYVDRKARTDTMELTRQQLTKLLEQVSLRPLTSSPPLSFCLPLSFCPPLSFSPPV